MPSGIRTRTSGIMVPAFVAPASGAPSSPPTSNLWGWWYTDGGAYTETFGTPLTLITVDGTSIGSLKDQSGNSRHMYQTVVASQPIYKTGQVGGKAAGLYANSVSSFLNTSGNNLTPSTPTSIYIVANASSWGSAFCMVSNDSAAPAFGVNQQGSSPNIDNFNNGHGGQVAMSLTTWHLISAIVNGATFYDIKVDNNASNNTTCPGGGTDNVPVTIGLFLSFGGTGWDGFIAEILIYQAQHSPTSGDGLLARQYLNGKYNLGLSI